MISLTGLSPVQSFSTYLTVEATLSRINCHYAMVHSVHRVERQKVLWHKRTINLLLGLPPLIKYSQIPDNRDEIAIIDRAKNYTNVTDITQSIPPLDSVADILLLLGRHIIEAHNVLDHELDKEFNRMDRHCVLVGLLLMKLVKDRLIHHRL